MQCITNYIDTDGSGDIEYAEFEAFLLHGDSLRKQSGKHPQANHIRVPSLPSSLPQISDSQVNDGQKSRQDEKTMYDAEALRGKLGVNFDPEDELHRPHSRVSSEDGANTVTFVVTRRSKCRLLGCEKLVYSLASAFQKGAVDEQRGGLCKYHFLRGSGELSVVRGWLPTGSMVTNEFL